MDHAARIWLHRTAVENYFRVRGFMDLDDLVGEGMLSYAKVLARYPEVKKPEHIMGLFMSVFNNRITDLARQRTVRKIMANETDLGMTPGHLDDMVAVEPTTSLHIALMPRWMRQLVYMIASDPYCGSTFAFINGHWETTDEKLCRILGMQPSDRTLLQQLHDYLSEGADLPTRMVRV